jgi:hypothetical protein
LPRIKAPLPKTTGTGQIKFSGFAGDVDFSIEGEPSRLKFGIARLKGFITAAPEIAERAFHAGEAMLTLASGEVLRLTLLGHTDQGREVFFEARV